MNENTSKTILFSEMQPGTAWEAEFNKWYDEEHIPVRMCLDGFDGAQRYIAREERTYLVVYDLASMGALSSPGYQKVKDEPSDQTRWMLKNVSNFTRYIGNEISLKAQPDSKWIEAPLIFTAMFNVPDDHLEDFDHWMVDEHVSILLGCKDWLAVRRFELKVADPIPFNRLAIHYLGSKEALASPEREQARNTEWRVRLAQQDWFNAGRAKAFERFGRRY